MGQIGQSRHDPLAMTKFCWQSEQELLSQARQLGKVVLQREQLLPCKKYPSTHTKQEVELHSLQEGL